jgi:hypothetical protein
MGARSSSSPIRFSHAWPSLIPSKTARGQTRHFIEDPGRLWASYSVGGLSDNACSREYRGVVRLCPFNELLVNTDLQPIPAHWLPAGCWVTQRGSCLTKPAPRPLNPHSAATSS